MIERYVSKEDVICHRRPPPLYSASYNVHSQKHHFVIFAIIWAVVDSTAVIWWLCENNNYIGAHFLKQIVDTVCYKCEYKLLN